MTQYHIPERYADLLTQMTALAGGDVVMTRDALLACSYPITVREWVRNILVMRKTRKSQ
jgi:hypothetical protein